MKTEVLKIGLRYFLSLFLNIGNNYRWNYSLEYMHKKGLGVKMKPSGIGGMAVMEGVMMKNKDEYAVAVRKPDKEIVVEKSTYKDFSDKVKLFKLPIFRGMLAFVDSMVVGMKVLNFSASFFEDGEPQTKKDKEKSAKKEAKKAKKDSDFIVEEVSVAHGKTDGSEHTDSKSEVADGAKKDEKSNAILMLFAVLISIVLSVTLFMVIPVFVTNLFIKERGFVFNLIEGLIRLAIFISYVVLASLIPDIKRTFMYHGAEHKTINCLENGFELTLENVRWQSKQHKRCGTSFMLFVIIISLLVFLLVPKTNLLVSVSLRVLLVPFIAGISYEFIRLAGKTENKIVNIISKPGLWMQGLTTKEPDDSMIEVAIQSVDAVYDWRAFLQTFTPENADPKKAPKQKNSVKISSTDVYPKPPVKEHTSGKDSSAKSESAATVNKVSGAYDIGKRNPGTAPINFKPVIPNRPEEEDDEILKALDKFFDDGQMDQGKAKKK